MNGGLTKNNTVQELNIVKVVKFIRQFGLLFVFVLMMLFFSLVTKTFLKPVNLINVLRQVSINGIIAVGMTFIIITGGIDISVGSIVAVAGVIAGSIVNKNPEAALSALLFGTFACTLFGLVNGIMIAKFRIPPFIMTMAMLSIGRGFALVYANGATFPIRSPAFDVLGKGYLGFIPVPVIILIFVALLGIIVLSSTRFGRYVYAVGGNISAAKATGISAALIITLVYVIGSTLAGLAGVVLASRMSTGLPAVGSGYELDAIAAVVIGGTSLSGGIGNVVGTLIGVLIIGIMNNGLDILNVSSYYQQIIKGIIIVAAVLADVNTKKQAN
jgi:ribose/xylose/arabinose/galactoside ABC-type transport system permease subunit